MSQPRILVLSHVLPYPRQAGQNQRVYHTLCALRERFHVTFGTVAAHREIPEMRARLLDLCDDVLLLPSRRGRGPLARAARRAATAAYVSVTGLKASNYAIGRLDLTPKRVAAMVGGRPFDCVLYEYWHAWESAAVFRQLGIPTVVDTHNILWESYRLQLEAMRLVPMWWRRWALRRYCSAEERAWAAFDGLIAINRDELQVIRDRTPAGSHVFYAPMGTDLSAWPYSWNATSPVRVGYYGGLGSPRNQNAAMQCLRVVMPAIWEDYPSAEMWLVGSSPPAWLSALQSDPRVHVTGYVEDVQSILGSMSLVLCPWQGTYGFRSRLVEMMALGVPVVAMVDAAAGMDLENGRGISLVPDEADMVRCALALLGDPSLAALQSRLARERVERDYGLDATYGRLVGELLDWLSLRKTWASPPGHLRARPV